MLNPLIKIRFLSDDKRAEWEALHKERRNKIYSLIPYIWFLVPCVSLVTLNQPMIGVTMKPDMSSSAAMPPERTYNGFQVLIHSSLVNDYSDIVIDMTNHGLVMLKIMIALQLIFDVILVLICLWDLWEWRRKQKRKMFLMLRGLLSIGYMLTARAISQYVLVCVHHLNPPYASSNLAFAVAQTDHITGNIHLSDGVVILFIVSWLIYKKKRKYEYEEINVKQNMLYKMLCYIWFLVPCVSLIRLSQPMITVKMGLGIDGFVINTTAALPEVTYNGLEVLIYDNLADDDNTIVIDMKNFEFVMLKIMIALQLIFDVILVLICLREWRRKQTSKIFLWIRGMLSIGYYQIASKIPEYAMVCVSRSNLVQYPYSAVDGRSYADYHYLELNKNILLSKGIVILFIVTCVMFLLTSKKTEKMLNLFIKSK